MHRYFGPDVERYAQRWRANPIGGLRMRQAGPFSASADGACLVALDDGFRAYVKPRPGANTKLVAAREKIVSDLAYDLGLPVPPVMVRSPDATWGDHVAVSLVCLPQTRLWGDGGVAHADKAVATLEALRVFWTWVADDDHNGHGENLLYEVHDTYLKLVAIDHSYSLGHSSQGNPLAVRASQGYGSQHLPGATGARDLTVAHIQAVGDGTIVDVVRRLHAILSASEQESILTLLRTRQAGLPALLGS